MAVDELKAIIFGLATIEPEPIHLLVADVVPVATESNRIIIHIVELNRKAEFIRPNNNRIVGSSSS